MSVLKKNTIRLNTLQQLRKNLLYSGNSINSKYLIKHLSTNLPNISENINDDDNTVDELKLIREKKIERKRNVSRLNPEHRNTLYNMMPFSQPLTETHLTVKYRRKMYGRYGSASGVNPGIMWPTKEDIKERKEYENIAFPYTIQGMVREELSKKEAEEAEIQARQKKIVENMKKLNLWIKELEAKRARNVAVAMEAKAKKDKLVDEVRRHFGYTVDHRDEKFQLMLEQKEKEYRLQQKLEKKQKRDAFVTKQLLEASGIKDDSAEKKE